jgi:flavin-dependent dehydrogenase
MHYDFDVIIVGARCAGAATALLLARAGARVLVIDKGAYGTDTLSTHALMRGAVMQLHRWGVLPRIQRSATPPVRSTTFGYRTSQTVIAIEPRYGVDALYAPRRTVLDRALVDEATLAGAQFSYGTTFTSLRRNASGRVSGLSMAAPGGLCELRAELVIGADGLYSTVARHAGAANMLTGVHTTATLYSYWDGVAAEGYEWHYGDRVSVGMIPTNAGLTCVFVSMPAIDLTTAARPNAAAGYDRVLRTRFANVAARIAGARRVEPVRGFGGCPGFLKQSVGDGWALVGDAGYFKDPLTAHGITDALRDAELLAGAAIRGTEAAFAAHHQMRHDLSRQLFAITDQVASFNWTDEQLQALHRGFSREMSREQRVIDGLESLVWQSPLANAPLVN